MSNFITDNIDIWTSSVVTKKSVGRGSSKKQEAYGIKKLRELILELAVCGKLVPQDLKDEPASILLEKIFTKKNNLKIESKTKKQKVLSEIKEDEKLYIIPDSWQWVRLGNIGETNIGLTYSPKNVGDKGIPVLRSTNVQKRKITLSDLVRVDMKVKDSAYVENNDLLICARNGSKALVGKTAMIKDLKEPMAFGAFMAIFRSSINAYIEVFLNSPIYRRNLDGTSTTTINQITQSNLKETLISIPPLAEQHRIVAKVDELMALCDKLEEEQEENSATHQTLVETLLGTLTNVETPEAFSEAWQRIAEHFDMLFTTEKSIDKLQETILQLAVMGKLVSQDPDDEPVSVLLEKVSEEKERLIKAGKIRKQKSLPQISEDEIIFRIPDNWKWARLLNYYDVRDGTHDSPKTQLTGYPLVTSKNLYTGKLDLSNVKYISKEDHLKINKRSKVDKGDILFAMIGSIGNPVIVNIDDEFSIKNVALFKYYNPEWVVPRYLQIYLKLASIDMKEKAAGGVQAFVSLGKLRSYIMPIPPLNEQKRIVTKVDELMVLCDRLRSVLRELQSTQINLADTVAKQLAE